MLIGRHWKFSLFVAVLFTFYANTFASASVVEEVQSHLYAGRTAAAANAAEVQLAAVPDDDQARFALGAVQFLWAAESLSQSLYRYGLKTSYQSPTGLASFPILRLPIPRNPEPDQITYEAFREVLAEFASNLQTAEATLSSITSDQIDLPLNIGLIRLDLNGDGNGSESETLWTMFRLVAGADWLDEAAASSLLVNFDGSDVAWLRAYCYLLMAIAEFPLTYDWKVGFETTFHGVFPDAGLPYSDEFSAVSAERFRFEYGAVADLIAFFHLIHWPVVEPERSRHVLGNLEAMVRLSRENWAGILAETDDRNEWIPSPEQTGALPRMAITESQLEGWQQFLDEFEAILEGRKLVPHWRFDQGINMRRFFLEPSTFDIVLLLQGAAAMPYLEKGELTSGETWRRIMQLFGGDFFRYFVWLN